MADDASSAAAAGGRFVLTKVSSVENDGFEQDVAVIRCDPDTAQTLLKRLTRTREIQAQDDDLYAAEYWVGEDVALFARAAGLADLILAEHEDGHPEAERVAGVISEFVGGDADVLCVADPEGCMAYAIDVYNGEDETKLNCRTVVVTEDTLLFTAQAAYGESSTIESLTIGSSHVRWLAGEDVPAPTAG